MKHAVPEIRRHELEDLKVAPEDIRAVTVLPKILKAVHQRPPDKVPGSGSTHGAVCRRKRIYRRKCLEEGLVLLEGLDEDEDTRGYEPLETIASSTVKSAIYNRADPCKEAAVSTLVSCWKRSLMGADPDSPTEDDFEGLEPSDLHRTLVSSKNKVSGTDVDGWVEFDDRHGAYQTVTEEDTAETLRHSSVADGNDIDEETGSQ